MFGLGLLMSLIIKLNSGGSGALERGKGEGKGENALAIEKGISEYYKDTTLHTQYSLTFRKLALLHVLK
jgi:hypothetical protein